MKYIILMISMYSIIIANTYNIKGIYKGNAEIKNNNISIILNNIKTEEFSNYEDIYPTTSGHRAFLYFELDGKKGADVSGYIYRTVIVLKKKSKDGLYNKQIGQIPLIKLNNQTIKIIFPIEYLSSKPIKIWTAQIYHKQKQQKKYKRLEMINTKNIDNNIKEVNVFLTNIKRIEYIKRKNGNGMYVKNNDTIFYLQKHIQLKKGGTRNSITMTMINGKRIPIKNSIQYYTVRLSCLKSNDIYFDCTDY